MVVGLASSSLSASRVSVGFACISSRSCDLAVPCNACHACSLRWQTCPLGKIEAGNIRSHPTLCGAAWESRVILRTRSWTQEDRGVNRHFQARSSVTCTLPGLSVYSIRWEATTSRPGRACAAHRLLRAFPADRCGQYMWPAVRLPCGFMWRAYWPRSCVDVGDGRG
jgi:hypothetical protein